MKEIPLTRGYITIVDDDDYLLLSKYKWFVLVTRRTSYARRSISKRKKLIMHRIIMNPQKGFEVDHIDGNGLNNQRSNLRVVTRRQNQQNRHLAKIGDFVGTQFDPRCNRWQSKICIKGKTKHLGMFSTAYEAHKRYLIEIASIGERYIR